MNRIPATLATIALLALVGCGGGSETLPPRSVSAAPDGAPSATATPTPAPSGMRLITAKSSGLRLAAPRSWTLIDASRLTDPSTKSQMEKMAESMNITLQQFRQMMTQIDLMAISPAVRIEQYGELNVVALSALAEIPTREAVRSQFGAMNMAVLAFDDLTTPVGEGLAVTVRKNVPGLGTTYARGLYVQMESGIVNVTVTHGTRKKAEDLMATIIPTFEDIGPREGSAGSGGAVEG